MRGHYRILLYLLFVVFILTLPLNSIYDTVAFFNGTIGDKTFVKTPFWFKLSKDIFLFFAVVLSSAYLIMRFNRKLVGLSIFFIVMIAFAAFSIFWMGPSMAAVLAIRSYLSIFFIFLGFYFFYFDPATVYPALRFIFYLELIVQIFQMFLAPNYYGGMSLFGYNMTNPGTFLIPSTMASFALISLLYARQKGDRLTEVFAILSVVLAKSATAYLIVFVFYSIQISRHFRFAFNLVATVVLFTAVVVFLNIDVITGRPGLINNVYARVGIFDKAAASPFGEGFGLGSGGSVLLHVENAVIADSTINSLLLNFGWIGFAVYFFFLALSVKYFRYHDLLLISFIAFSLTMIIFEMTPFIQFYFFELGRRMRKQSEEITQLAHG